MTTTLLFLGGAQINMRASPFSRRRQDGETDFVTRESQSLRSFRLKLNFIWSIAMTERRAMKRISINRAARLSFGEISGTHPCLVRDISALGACISAPYYIFASEFVLSFDGHSGDFVCRVAWRNETLCGVCFLGRLSPKLTIDSDKPTSVVRLYDRLRVGLRPSGQRRRMEFGRQMPTTDR
jgi:hypothetical protein